VTKISRRAFLKAAGAASAMTGAVGAVGLVAAMGVAEAATAPKDVHAPAYLFFNRQEAAFIEAACARLIPSDGVGPGAIEAGVPNYLDKQLGGAWGVGERLYRSGPWQAGTPSQGYQLPFTPAELFRKAMHAIDAQFAAQGKTFSGLTGDEQDAYLKSLEKGGIDLDGIPSDIFFKTLLGMTVEGYFGDPAYGGNKDMVSWRMIGFPGAYASYYDLIDKHGIKLDRAPMSIAQAPAMGNMHTGPDIPAKL
jgi:gluconate 2-dehydrogenase gamma chain